MGVAAAHAQPQLGSTFNNIMWLPTGLGKCKGTGLNLRTHAPPHHHNGAGFLSLSYTTQLPVGVGVGVAVGVCGAGQLQMHFNQLPQLLPVEAIFQ